VLPTRANAHGERAEKRLFRAELRLRATAVKSVALLLALIGGMTGLAAGLVMGATPTRADAQAHGQAAFRPANAREQFAVDLLAGLGNGKPSLATIAFVVEWTIAEDGGDGALARNNPLNTTICGYNNVGAINGDGACGVSGYASYQDGLDATVATLAQANFAPLTAALQQNDPQAARAALIASPWAESHYDGGRDWPVVEVRAPAQPSGKHPVTGAMAVSANFYATGSPAWAGQAGGMHLGTDFAGNPGDNVYMPFDCTFDQTGFYEDAARWGHFLICYFGDGTLFYSGHLQDVIQPAQGTLIPAGTVIGHIGQLLHTHVKLEPPGSPHPCEGAGTCINFEDYYATH
jgi:murein DD-endopeptidase MepM/ murein hydrolase activator NlpD